MVRAALEAYRAGRADFADYLIGAMHHEGGCGKTVTFDRRLRARKLFQVL